MKKVFIISSALLVILLFFFGIYRFSFYNGSKDSHLAESEKGLPGINGDIGKIGPITGGVVISPSLSKGGDTIMYLDSYSGMLKEIFNDGKFVRDISKKNFSEVNDIKWSPKKDKIVMRTEQGMFYIFDINSKEKIELRSGIDNILWDNLGSKIIYKYFDAEKEKRSVNIADPNGDNWKKLTDIPFRDIGISQIPKSSLVSFWPYPDSFSETSLNVISISEGEGMKIFSGKFGADYLWSPDGGKALVSFSREKGKKGSSNISLGTVKSDGDSFRDLSIPTLVSKCVWADKKDIIYCALPTSSLEDSVLPNDYLSGKKKTNDTFWEIDVVSGKKERIIELEELDNLGREIDASELFLSKEGKFLFFVNRHDGRLYRLEV